MENDVHERLAGYVEYSEKVLNDIVSLYLYLLERGEAKYVFDNRNS